MEAAAEVAEFERAHVDAITELVRTEKIDCDFVLTKAIDCFQKNAELQRPILIVWQLPALNQSAEWPFTDGMMRKR
jgi:hypothetical protein